MLKIAPAPGYSDTAAPYIRKLGGKLGGQEYLREHVPELREMLLQTVLIPKGQHWNGAIPDRFNGSSGIIVRASDHDDWGGLVDTLRTIHAETEADVPQAIDRVRTDARRQAVISFAHHENPSSTYDGEVAVGLQPFIPNDGSYNLGTIVEHPNQPGRYLISWRKRKSFDDPKRDIGTGLFSERAERMQELCSVSSVSKGQALNPHRLIDMYRKIRASGLVTDDMSFEVEFGGHKGLPYPLIYQVRAFMRFALADFRIEPDTQGRIQSPLVFGVTDAEGLILPVIHSKNGVDHAGQPVYHDRPGEPWAWLRTKHDKRPPLEFQPNDMTAVLFARRFQSGVQLSPSFHNQGACINSIARRINQGQQGVVVYEPIEESVGDRPSEIADFAPAILSKAAEVREEDGMSEEQIRDACLSGNEFQFMQILGLTGDTGVSVRVVSDGHTATVDVVE